MSSRTKKKESGDDFVYRFELSVPESGKGEEDALARLIRDQVNSLLDVVSLTSSGENIEVDGFKFLYDDVTVHPL